MNSQRRLVYYLLINVFVSALVAGSIIFYYDRNHHVECPAALAPVTVAPGTSAIQVSMIGVVGAGNISDERIIIQNNGVQELDLTGWSLTDAHGNSYTFPKLTLFPGVKVNIHTNAGQDTPSDLYWSRLTPVWSSGELAALYDTQNIARAFYRIP
jgi:hypothetical protein